MFHWTFTFVRCEKRGLSNLFTLSQALAPHCDRIYELPHNIKKTLINFVPHSAAFFPQQKILSIIIYIKSFRKKALKSAKTTKEFDSNWFCDFSCKEKVLPRGIDVISYFSIFEMPSIVTLNEDLFSAYRIEKRLAYNCQWWRVFIIHQKFIELASYQPCYFEYLIGNVK